MKIAGRDSPLSARILASPAFPRRRFIRKRGSSGTSAPGEWIDTASIDKPPFSDEQRAMSNE
jgi:hypothetical protein